MIIKIPPYYDEREEVPEYLRTDLWNWMHEVTTSLETVSANGITELDTTSGNAIPVNGIVNVVGGSGVSTSASGNTLTISVAFAGFTWNSVTSADNPVQIVAENGYICNGGSQVIFILPLTPNIGDTFTILSATATFRINQNGGQSIRIGTHITTPGNTGFINSNSAGDNIEIIYVGSNLFLAQSPQGSITAN